MAPKKAHCVLLVLAVAFPAVEMFQALPRLATARYRSPQQQQRILLCAEEPEEASSSDVDWRELRAKLVAQERKDDGMDDGEGAAGGFVYESPLIETGSVILGGTKQDFGFALRQQYFHKCVMLLLHHDEGFTKGIILNRPSAYVLDGWRVWFGGDVAEGAEARLPEKAAQRAPCPRPRHHTFPPASAYARARRRCDVSRREGGQG